MRRISAALLGLTILAGGIVGCESNENYYDDDGHRSDRIGSRDWDHDRDWNRNDRRDWDRDRRDGDKRDWNKRDRDWDHDDHLRRDHDHRGQGLTDPDFNRNTWDRR
jgi:hypothetical protein